MEKGAKRAGRTVGHANFRSDVIENALQSYGNAAILGSAWNYATLFARSYFPAFLSLIFPIFI